MSHISKQLETLIMNPPIHRFYSNTLGQHGHHWERRISRHLGEVQKCREELDTNKNYEPFCNPLTLTTQWSRNSSHMMKKFLISRKKLKKHYSCIMMFKRKSVKKSKTIRKEDCLTMGLAHFSKKIRILIQNRCWTNFRSWELKKSYLMNNTNNRPNNIKKLKNWVSSWIGHLLDIVLFLTHSSCPSTVNIVFYIIF